MRALPKELLSLLDDQVGLVHRQQALALLSEERVHRLLRPGSRWKVAVRGVYASFTGALTDEQRRMAGILYAARLHHRPADPVPTWCRDTVAITGLEGCRLRGFRRLPEYHELAVLVPHDRRRQGRGFVTVERTARFPEDTALVQGVPVASIARCVIDACRGLTDLDAVRALIAEAVQRRRTTVNGLHEELDLGRMNGSARPRQALKEIGAGAHSVAEVDGIAAFQTSTVLPPLHYNCSLWAPDSRAFLATPDAYAADVGLAGEVQSVEHHLFAEDQEADFDRKALLAGYGVQVVEFRPKRLRAEPGDSREKFEAAYVARVAQGVRPNVQLRCRPGCTAAARAS